MNAQDMLAVYRRPFCVPTCQPPQISDNALRLMVQAARHNKLVLDYTNRSNDHSGILGHAADPDGILHRRSTVKSWGARRLFTLSWEGHVVTVELTTLGIDWLIYLRNMLNEVPL